MRHLGRELPERLQMLGAAEARARFVELADLAGQLAGVLDRRRHVLKGVERSGRVSVARGERYRAVVEEALATFGEPEGDGDRGLGIALGKAGLRRETDGELAERDAEKGAPIEVEHPLEMRAEVEDAPFGIGQEVSVIGRVVLSTEVVECRPQVLEGGTQLAQVTPRPAGGVDVSCRACSHSPASPGRRLSAIR